MKAVLYGLLLATAFVITLLLWQIWQNNQTISPVKTVDLQQHFTRSVSWLNSNYQTLQNTRNPILWWMIKQAALTSGNDTLEKVFSEYKKNHLDNQPANLSTPMFNKFYHPRLPDITLLSHLDDYQIFFFYALSCDSELATEPLIQKQQSTSN